MVVNEQILNRKKDHLQIVAEKNVNYNDLSAGFDNYHFVHNALPELNLNEIDISTKFLGYDLSFPLLINSMTGGEELGKELNKTIAKVANQEKVAFGLGSIRPALENPAAIASYTVAKENAPDIPVIANIGAAQLNSDLSFRELFQVLKQIGADAISIHLNPLQEALQPEGDTNFEGVENAIGNLLEKISIPIIVKEVGFGLSSDIIQRLIKLGVKWIDISGAGGTSWAKVEKERNQDFVDRKVAEEFGEWGIPTVSILEKVVNLNDIKLIASGGIDSGLKFAKAIALGASIGGLAGPFLKCWNEKGEQGVREFIKILRKTLRISLFCTGCKSILDFRKNFNIIKKKRH